MSDILEAMGGPVDSEVSVFRDTDEIVYYGAITGITCPTCGGGEVWQPMQTMDMPMYLSCLKCGEWNPSKEFNHNE